MARYMSVSATTTTTLTSEEAPKIDQIKNGTNKTEIRKENDQPKEEYKTIIGTYGAELKWVNLIGIFILHGLLVWSFFSYPFLQKYKLFLYGVVLGGLGGFGVTGGAHRYWSHRSYKAKLPLRIILMICFSAAAQNSLFEWIRDHRVHHRFTETDADPHNSKRGFFFAHVGWLMMKKHREVLRRGKEVDMSDVLADPVVQFHQKHFVLLKILLGFIIPTVIPPLLWGEDWFWSFLMVCVGRYALSLNFTWLVNSAAHMWGTRPYDRKISPRENLTVSILAMGEGWHNYHHTFPWDYKTAELGNYTVNLTTFWLDVFAKIGWAYDLKTPSKELIERVIKKTGDDSHYVWGHFEVPEESLDAKNIINNNNNNENDCHNKKIE